MTYIDRIVKPGETLLVSARPHWIMFLGAVPPLVVALAVAVWAALAAQTKLTPALYLGALLLLALGLMTLARRLLDWSTTEFGVTNHRVIVKRGLFSLHTVEMNVDKVESVDVDQTILGRLFNYGDITIRGTGETLERLRMIDHPLEFRNHVTAV